MNDSALIMRAMDSFRARHRVHRLDALETTNTPGYWRLKETCTGECGAGHTRAIRHSVHYAEPNARNAQARTVLREDHARADAGRKRADDVAG